ncbi:hypothetical protein RIF29_38080 [Crotalaria pallida]|uniref:Uncharacterized protein n=1 Tax=Crotalaria pallida TaxID=3830 RepID=A0AAN9HPC4_CROPI
MRKLLHPKQSPNIIIAPFSQVLSCKKNKKIKNKNHACPTSTHRSLILPRFSNNQPTNNLNQCLSLSFLPCQISLLTLTPRVFL